MKLTKVEFDILMTGIQLNKIDEKDRAIRQAQMNAYAIGKKKPKWNVDFGNSETERLVVLYGEDYVDSYRLTEAQINQRLTDMVSELEYPEFD